MTACRSACRSPGRAGRRCVCSRSRANSSEPRCCRAFARLPAAGTLPDADGWYALRPHAVRARECVDRRVPADQRSAGPRETWGRPRPVERIRHRLDRHARVPDRAGHTAPGRGRDRQSLQPHRELRLTGLRPTDTCRGAILRPGPEPPRASIPGIATYTKGGDSLAACGRGALKAGSGGVGARPVRGTILACSTRSCVPRRPSNPAHGAPRAPPAATTNRTRLLR